MNLYLLPGARENLYASIYQSVSLALLEKHLGSTKTHDIIQKVRNEKIHCWAFGSGSRSNYDNMREDDVVLLKENGTETFRLKGRVAYKIMSESLGKNLWPISTGEPWKFIFFVRDLVYVDIPFSRLREELGYDRNSWLGGAKRVSDNRLIQAIRKFGTFDRFIAYLEGGITTVPRIGVIRRPGAGRQGHRPPQPTNQTPISPHDDDPWKI